MTHPATTPQAHRWPTAASTVRRGEVASAAVTYDFRRPIQLSREHQRMLQICFDTFVRQATTLMTSTLRTVCAVTLDAIEQHTYSEYIQSLDATTYMTLFTAEPMHGRCVLNIPLQTAMASIDHMLGGPGGGSQPNRPLSDIEEQVFGALVERLLGELRYALEGTIDIEPEVVNREYSPQFAQVAAASDVVVVISCDVLLGNASHKMTICMPFTGLLPRMVAASAPTPVSDRERLEQAQAAEQLNVSFQDVPVDVAIRFRTTRVAPDVIAGLAVGDVLTLDHPAAAPLDVGAGQTSFAHATPGARGPRLAALIVSPSKEI